MNKTDKSLLSRILHSRNTSFPCFYSIYLGLCHRGRRQGSPETLCKVLSYFTKSNIHVILLKIKALEITNWVFSEGPAMTKVDLWRAHSSSFRYVKGKPLQSCHLWGVGWPTPQTTRLILAIMKRLIDGVTFPTADTLIFSSVAVTDLTCSLPAGPCVKGPSITLFLHSICSPLLLQISAHMPTGSNQYVCLSVAL